MECPDSSSEYSEDLQDYDYYDDSADNVCENMDDDSVSTVVNDPEFVEYSCLHTGQVDTLLKAEIDEITNSLSTIPSLAKLLLHLHGWNIEKIKKEFSVNPKRFLLQNGVVVAEKCSTLPNSSNCDETMMLNAIYTTAQNVNNVGECSICCESSTKALISLNCGHLFCRNCWQHHMETQLQNGVSTKIECMSTDCRLICPEYFALNIITEKPLLKSKYEEMVFRDFVVSHPHLRWCPGRNCNTILYCKTMKAHRVTCTSCNTKFCFLCGQNYHAPASCDIIKKWLIKCADDSETANYISAHTKDCPNCHSCIEKNGGCNHMQCSKCKFHFCWMCFRDWKSHGSEYYECSRYKENPAIAQEANYLKARRALEKYLHYYERFENHSKSLKMEEELRVKIKTKIEEKISRHEGTWIDWQYLHSASHLLTKCRYTLQYTYPFAYYIEPSARKELFEYQQAQLEKEIEELSWKVERAETTDRGELENQMHIAEQKRRTLLQDFFN